LALYGRNALAKDAGVSPDGTGSSSAAMPVPSPTRTGSRGRLREQQMEHNRAARFPNRSQCEEVSMSPTKDTQKSAKSTTATNKTSKRFTDEERAAMKERSQELKASARANKNKTDGESDVLAKIAEMKEPDRSMAKRLHAIIKASAPALSPRTWYGMPAYAKDGNVVCFFQSAQKFKTRYATLGFSDKANLDEGAMWPTAFAVKELAPTEEAKIVALLKKAVG
jgi:uncharacterized protein YdhG (YjbR/CyaY superfamily)